MCFTKSSSIKVDDTVAEDTVERHEADADVTKNSQTSTATSSYKQNVKTSASGLSDEAKTQKKTLLGE